MPETIFKIIKNILPAFGFHETNAEVQVMGNGLIHKTWKIDTGGNALILQQVNTTIFTQPEDIVHNTQLISTYLNENVPGYLFVSPLATTSGEYLFFVDDHCYRIFPFVKDSHSKNIATTAAQASEAAAQFGKFTKLLAGIEINKLKITIPHFHDLALRYQQFIDAVNNGNKLRIGESVDLINIIFGYKDIATTYSGIISNSQFKLRVTHHDTK